MRAPLAPVAGESDGDGKTDASQANASIQDASLNGAQITSLAAIISAVAAGQMPLETARGLIVASFTTIDENEADRILAPLKDFTPIARTAMQPLALLVNPSVPAKNLQEFMAYAKSKPGQINYGSAGNGGISHLVPEMFKTATGLFMVHIPYRGSAPAFTDLMGGQVQFMAESIPQAAAYHKQGKVRALAVTSRARNPALPDVPTVIESGLKGFEVVGFYGFLAPAGTPKDVVAKLSDAFGKVMQSPEVKSRMVSQGADPAFLGADDFAKFLAAEMPRWADAVKKSGAKLD
jgi:tripartite-type tricarboxylate transporter receptor subunit TctC